MLTDTKLRNLKPQDKLYKVNDRDGLYVAITPAGSISFRYNYSINGRQETSPLAATGQVVSRWLKLANVWEQPSEWWLTVSHQPKRRLGTRRGLRMRKHSVLGLRSGLRATRWRTPLGTCAVRSIYGNLKQHLVTRSWPRSPTKICGY